MIINSIFKIIFLLYFFSTAHSEILIDELKNNEKIHTFILDKNYIDELKKLSNFLSEDEYKIDQYFYGAELSFAYRPFLFNVKI